jgi:hypothetical protein
MFLSKDHTDLFVKIATKTVDKLDSLLAQSIIYDEGNLGEINLLLNKRFDKLSVYQRYKFDVTLDDVRDDCVTKYLNKYNILDKLVDVWIKTINHTWAVCYDKSLSKQEITEIYKTFTSNESTFCSNCAKDWMRDIYLHSDNRSILTPSILIRWAYASEDEDGSDEVRFMCNKYNATNPEELFNWKKTFTNKMLDFLTDIKYPGKKFDELPEETETEKTIKYAVAAQDRVSVKNYCIAFNCIDVDIAFDYWKQYGQQIGRAVANHKKKNGL